MEKELPLPKKAFDNFKTNGIHLRFPNGNAISTTWGVGSYSDNHDEGFRGDGGSFDPNDFQKAMNTLMESDTCEIYFLEVSQSLKEKLELKYNDGSPHPFGYCSIKDWLEIVNAVANEDRSLEKLSK